MPSYSHLSTWEREQLAALKAAGASGNSMARALGRSPATISRELRRNRLPCGGYSQRQADGAYLERRRRDAILECDRRLRQFVTDRLAEGWSPEQIAGWLKRNTEPKLRTLVTETIYAFIYRAAQQPEKLWRYLVRRRPRRRPLRARPSRDTIKNRRSIHDRPASAADRNEVPVVPCPAGAPETLDHEATGSFSRHFQRYCYDTRFGTHPGGSRQG
ncbi:IS30 family transposase [Aurantimonas sp. C2-6-R+9]|uniref:IS30 family transposase n=1 Tax=unclassified Aurantimonas TaxID=2638230 RepID=UPI002E17FC21|nr:IS30 family transposase [Aurantimonas sp. C2-6-R+9]